VDTDFQLLFLAFSFYFLANSLFIVRTLLRHETQTGPRVDDVRTFLKLVQSSRNR